MKNTLISLMLALLSLSSSRAAEVIERGDGKHSYRIVWETILPKAVEELREDFVFAEYFDGDEHFRTEFLKVIDEGIIVEDNELVEKNLLPYPKCHRDGDPWQPLDLMSDNIKKTIQICLGFYERYRNVFPEDVKKAIFNAKRDLANEISHLFGYRSFPKAGERSSKDFVNSIYPKDDKRFEPVFRVSWQRQNESILPEYSIDEWIEEFVSKSWISSTEGDFQDNNEALSSIQRSLAKVIADMNLPVSSIRLNADHLNLKKKEYFERTFVIIVNQLLVAENILEFFRRIGQECGIELEFLYHGGHFFDPQKVFENNPLYVGNFITEWGSSFSAQASESGAKVTIEVGTGSSSELKYHQDEMNRFLFKHCSERGNVSAFY